MTTIDTNRLRELANDATPGPWAWDDDGRPGSGRYKILWGAEEANIMRADPHAADTLFIAAVSPDVVLALLDRIAVLEREVASLEIRAGLRAHPDAVGGFCPGPDTDPMNL